MTQDDVIAEAKRQISAAGGVEEWRKRVGLSHAYVHRQVKGIDPPGDKFLKALRIEVSRVIYARASA